MKCVDVERRFTGYRISYEAPDFAATQDPWHKRIVCRSGHIAPAGGRKLWACARNKTNAATALRRGQLKDGTPLRCAVRQDGDDGVNAEFDVADFQAFFTLMKAVRR